MTEADTGSTTITFTVTRSGATAAASSVDYAISGSASYGSDFNNISTGTINGTISFASDEISKTITLDVSGDFRDEDDETIVVTLSNGTTNGGVTTYSDNPVTTTITDDDTTEFTITLTDGSTQVAESGTTDTFDVVLDVEPGSNVVFDLVSGNADEATINKSQLTFTSGDWNLPQTVTVTGVDDDTADGDTTTAITVSINVAGSHSDFAALAAKTVQVTTLDDDPEISVIGNEIEIADEDTVPSVLDHTDFGDKNFNGQTYLRIFTIRNSGSSPLMLTGSPAVSVTGTNASEFIVTTDPSTPVAAGGETTFEVSFTPIQNGLRTAEISIENNDSDETIYNFAIQGTSAGEDLDGDGMADDWELANGLDPTVDDATLDFDDDGLRNIEEYHAGTNADRLDTDDDGMPDKWEIDNLLDPLSDDSSQDPDGDLYSNIVEYRAGTDPQDSDSKPNDPVADAGPDQTVEPGTMVILNGLNSSVPGAIITDYQWIHLEGAAVTLENHDHAQSGFLADMAAPSSTTIQLTVTDDNGLQSSDTVIVNIVEAAQPPVADAGAEQSVNSGVIVTLDGSGSYDPDGSIDSYVWIQTTGELVTLDDTTPDMPELDATGLFEQTLVFDLTVTDNEGLKASSQTIVNITDAPIPETTVPVAEAGEDQIADESQIVTLDASNSSDPSGYPLQYHWTQLSGPAVILSDIFAAQPTLLTPPVDADGALMTFQLTVKNASGLSSSDTVTITVNDIYDLAADSGAVFTCITGDMLIIRLGLDATITDFRAVDPDSVENSDNMPDLLPYGLIDFTIKTTPGATVEVEIEFPEPLADTAGWCKYDSQNGWSDFSASAMFSEDRVIVRLTLTDGGEGDADGIVNGEITDVYGPAAETHAISYGSGSDSGCFINSLLL